MSDPGPILNFTPERWEQLKEIFHSLVECEPRERARLLDQACADDPELRRQLELLLESDEDAKSFLEVSPAKLRWGAMDFSAAALPADVIGPRAALPPNIGRYRIIRLIGEGGMGAVYEAEQENPRRTVALKVIKPGLASPEILRRFEQEAQALGRLQHAGIAQIYEAGTADTGFGPQPYFAMEFVAGKMLADYVEAHHLNLRERLEIVEKLADAVHHAHQRGLIHRDLKPANILVLETGQPKVLDFGVARVTDIDGQATLQTHVGQLVGTPAYMSPEQVLADPLELDTRTDVYALGVILYELLAGRLPYTLSNNLQAALQAIRGENPAKLSSISRHYRGDIETIVAKALEKDKARRYGSAAELAADIQRYRHDEPIMARRPSTSYQLRKFARRNKALVTGVAAVFAALVGGVVAFASMANLYHFERDHANAEASKAKAVLEFMGIALFGKANPYAQSDSGAPIQARSSPNPNITLKEALDLSAQQIPALLDGQPLQEAAIREFVADTYIGIGHYSEGRDQLERALALRRREQGYTNPETLQTTAKLADDCANLRIYSTAEDLAKQVVIDARRTTGDVDLYVQKAVSILVWIYSGTLTNADQSRGFSQVERFLKDDVIDYQLRKSEKVNSTIQFAVGGLLSLYTDSKPPKYSDAAVFMQRIANDWRRTLGEGNPATLEVEKQLIGLYLIPQPQPRYAEAEAYLKPLVETQRRELGDDSIATQATINYLVSVYLNQPLPRYVETETFLKRVKEEARGKLGNGSRAVRNASIGLANLYFKQARYTEAADLLTPLASNAPVEEAMAHPVTLEIQPGILNKLDRAQIYGKRSNTALADSMARLTMTEQPTILDILDLSAQIYLKQGNSAGANLMSNKLRTTLEAALKSERKTGSRSKNSVTALKSLGAIAIRYINAGRYVDAEDLLSTVIDGYRQQLAVSDANAQSSAKLLTSAARTNSNPGNDSQTSVYQQLAGNGDAREVATLLTSIAVTYSSEGMDLQAEKMLKAILDVNRAVMGDSNWDTQRSLWRLASWYVDRDRYEEARDTFDRLNKVQGVYYGPGHRITRTTMVDTMLVYGDKFKSELAVGRKDHLRLLLEANLDIRNRLLVLYRSESGGEKSGDSRAILSGIGVMLAMLGRYPQAADKFTELIAIQETAEGVQQESKPAPIANLGWTQFHQQKFPEAEANLRKALRWYEEIQSDTWERYNTESMLGATLVAARKYDEAEKYLLDSYEKLSQRDPGPVPTHGFTGESKPGERTLKLYNEWGKPEEAAKWREKLGALKGVAAQKP